MDSSRRISPSTSKRVHVPAESSACRIDYLNTYRLKMAANLLRGTDRTVTEIALSCGFNHLSYFSKTFLQTYGCTPTAYRGARQ